MRQVLINMTPQRRATQAWRNVLIQIATIENGGKKARNSGYRTAATLPPKSWANLGLIKSELTKMAALSA
jgi:hypothetical protein